MNTQAQDMMYVGRESKNNEKKMKLSQNERLCQQTTYCIGEDKLYRPRAHLFTPLNCFYCKNETFTKKLST